jgi:hypothetical protein
MKINKIMVIPFVIFLILFILNRQCQFKFSHIFEKSIGLLLVIYYTIIDIKYGILFGVMYMIYLMKWNHNFYIEKIENNNKVVEFFINKPQESITTDRKYTAVIVEPRQHKALEFVLNNFMENLNDDWAFIIFHSNTNKNMVENIMNTKLEKYKSKTKLINLNIESKNFTIKEYSTLFYDKTFYDYIPSETFLIFQTDSIILKENKDKINDFLQYDYVGAPWPKVTGFYLGDIQVGNGGLSLRKKSKMLELLKYKDIAIDNSNEKPFGKYIAEDRFFNGYNEKIISINKPPFDKAKCFSVECIYCENSFGIHKLWAHLNKNEVNILKNKYPDINTLINLQETFDTNIVNSNEEKNPKILIIISSKSPNPYLYNCIQNLYKIQIKDNRNYKICVIDSDSNDFTNYNKIRKEFPAVELHFVKNENYEFGAYKYAYSKYPNYDIYFCIQDSNIVNNYIDTSIVNNTNAYTYHHKSGYNSHLTIKDKGINLLNNTGLNYSSIIDTNFTLAQHSIMIVNNYIMTDILNTFKILPVDKEGSCCYERNLGIYFIVKKINTHNLSEKINKKTGGRM